MASRFLVDQYQGNPDMNDLRLDDDSPYRVGVVDTGVANLVSIQVAFRRIGVEVSLVRSADEVASASGIVLPGVGRFGSGMEAVDRRGLIDPIRKRVESGRPLFAICLGLQMLCSGSEESPGVPGIGALDTVVRRLPPGSNRPHLGWNRVVVEGDAESRLVVSTGAAYFANGFALSEIPAGWSGAWSSDGGRFVAAIEREGVVACQFHPELSGSFGREVLSRWMSLVQESSSCC